MTWTEEVAELIPWRQVQGCWRLAEWWGVAPCTVMVLATGRMPRGIYP
jgi:hypothetical protein